MRTTRLRTLSVWATLVLLAVTALSAAVLFMLATSIADWAELLDHRADGVLAATELEQRLQDYNRAWNLREAGVPGAEEGFETAQRRLDRAMARTESLVISATEAAAMRQVQGSIARWSARRSSLEGEGLDSVIRAQYVLFDAALSSISTLRLLNRRDLEHAQEEIAAQATQQRFIALGALGLETLGLLGVLASLILVVVQPMRELDGTVRRYSRGELTVRAAERGPAELTSIARAFNGLADALARQGQDRLAHLGGVVHDLRDPLTAASLASARLRQVIPESDAQTVDILKRHLDRMERMIQDILDASRIEAGMLELQIVPVELGEVLQRVVQDARLRAPTHEITLRLPETPLRLPGDPSRLEQVFTNLVSNAIKYSGSGSRVSLDARDEGPTWAISVRDEGAGLLEEDLERIFLPFQRVTRSTQGIAGVGLGLSVVRRIVDAHHGSLQVQSAPGAGSTFTVRLPRSGSSLETPSASGGSPSR